MSKDFHKFLRRNITAWYEFDFDDEEEYGFQYFLELCWQENLTEQIADCLDKLLSPKYLKVTMVCTHTCVELRGAEKPCKTKTIAERGERNGKAKIQKDTEK